MNVLITNDDGIDAPGLQALVDAVDANAYIVAPATVKSECSHSVTTRNPILVEDRGHQRWAVHGTPVDCVRIATSNLLEHVTIDWVLSGINAGGNLGIDIYPSGTVAAAREATILGYKALAISQYRRAELKLCWKRATHYAQSVLGALLDDQLSEREFWNINLPHLEPNRGDPELSLCPPCKHPLPMKFDSCGARYSYAGIYRERTFEPGTDTDLCFQGRITASVIGL